MRIAIVSPAEPTSPGGNARTVARWRDLLEAGGHDARVVVASADSTGRDVGAALALARPDATILYHARRAGRFVDEARAHRPVLVALGGTDLDVDAREPARRDVVARALCLADLVLAASEEQAARVVAELPCARGRVRVVPKSVSLPPSRQEAIDARVLAGAGPGSVLVVLPSGLRAVKDPTFAVRPLEALRAEGLDVRLLVLGPEVEPDVVRAFDALAVARPWLRRRLLPPGHVRSALLAADLVLNTSRSEGYSNAIAEAVTLGRAVLASDVPGNRAALEDGKAGALYAAGDEASFLERARPLVADPGARASLERAAGESARRRFAPAREASALQAAIDEARHAAERRRPSQRSPGTLALRVLPSATAPGSSRGA